MGEANALRTLGRTIRERRIQLGWSQEELAVRASPGGQEVRQSDVSRLEQDKVGLPRRERLELIAAPLGLPLGELLVRSGWAGADAALRDAERPSPATVLPATAPIAASGPESLPDPEASPRLRAAIDRAHALEAWSADLMCRSAAAFERANRSAGPAPTRRAADQPA